MIFEVALQILSFNSFQRNFALLFVHVCACVHTHIHTPTNCFNGLWQYFKVLTISLGWIRGQ